MSDPRPDPERRGGRPGRRGGGPGRGGGRPGRRETALALAALGLLAIMPPGRRALRKAARWLDSRVEGFSGPQARGYAAFASWALYGLYVQVTKDVAAELAAATRVPGEVEAEPGVPSQRRPSRTLAVLDIGCGPGDLAAMLSERLPDARIVGLDLSPKMIELAQGRHETGSRLTFCVGDAAGLPFDSAAFDVVVSTLSLHHWPDPAAALSEIDRVLRPGGFALIYDLRPLTVDAGEWNAVADLAGLDRSRLGREPLSGGLPARLFVRFRVARPIA